MGPDMDVHGYGTWMGMNMDGYGLDGLCLGRDDGRRKARGGRVHNADRRPDAKYGRPLSSSFSLLLAYYPSIYPFIYAAAAQGPPRGKQTNRSLPPLWLPASFRTHLAQAQARLHSVFHILVNLHTYSRPA